jgi:hypothetical protein
MSASLNHVAFSIERPERVSEQVVRIVELLDLAKAFPVVSEGSLGSLRRLVTTEKLYLNREEKKPRSNTERLTLGRGPPSWMGLRVPEIH